MRQRGGLWVWAGIVLALAAAFTPVAARYIKRYSLHVGSVAGIYGCFVLLTAYLAAPALPAGRAVLGKLLSGRNQAIVVAGLLVLPYLLYAAGTGDFRWLALVRLLLIAGPVLALYSLIPVRDTNRFSWQDSLVALWLVSIVILHQFNGIWNVPANLDFMARLFMVALGSLCWIYVRPVPDLGYEIRIAGTIFKSAALNFVYFAAIAIPLGLVLGFTAWNPRWHSVGDFFAAYLEIFLFVAILEELFFRGFLQNLFEKSMRSWWRAQLLASCLFGLFHILHAPFPNWRYVILASIAGWFYGSAYRHSGTLLSSALLHAMVDTVWRTFFAKT